MSDMSQTQEKTQSAGTPSGGLVSDIKSKASSLAETARSRLAEGVEPMKEKAREVAEEQKASGAQKISGVAQAVHRAAGEFEREMPEAAEYIHGAASSLERASEALKERSVDDMLGELGRFARQQPGAVFGAAMLAGFALSRFLKSSADPSRQGGLR
jgi:F0F1-type ATP synthase membrane subunit b/b'